MNELRNAIETALQNRFHSKADVVAAAPGRVNLIGEHTDYTGGFVLPVAIDREIVFAAARTDTTTINGYSLDFDGLASCEAGSYDPSHESGWFRYVMGVLDELKRMGKAVGGFNFSVGGNVPIGSGLSSSAALEMATLTAMEGLFGFSLSDSEAALLCQRAENNFVGMSCGIMDQYISKTGKRDHAVLIDCRDLSIRPIPINTEGYSWLIIDSNKRRGLVDSEYNNRRLECEEGGEVASRIFSKRGVQGLRDLDVGDIPALEGQCSDVVLRRVSHVVSENDRVLRTVRALETGDVDEIGKCLYASHASLRDDFEVSCAELDMIVDILSEQDGVKGARLTGAGFGGCVIALLKTEAVDDVTAALMKAYQPESLPEGTEADIWPICISDGARIL